MKKLIMLQAILLLTLEGYSHAAEADCNDNSLRIQAASGACNSAPLPQQKEAQNEPAPPLPRTTTASLTQPQNVLCSQCQQNAATF